MIACQTGDLASVTQLLPTGSADPILPAFILAIQNQQIDVVKLLLPLNNVQESLRMSDECVRAALATKNLGLLQIIADELEPRGHCEMGITSAMASDIRVLQILYPVFGCAPNPTVLLRYLAFYSCYNKRLPVIEWALFWDSIVDTVPMDDRSTIILNNLQIALRSNDKEHLEAYLGIILSPVYRDFCVRNLEPALAGLLTFRIIAPFLSGAGFNGILIPEIRDHIAWLLYQQLVTEG